jgi:hypothetical protein
MNTPSTATAEGRVDSTRPSGCLRLLAGLVVLVALSAAPVARAAQPERVALTETNPLSTQAQPAASTEPFIIGRGDGAIATVVNPFRGGLHSPIAADINPNNQVDIYANGTCAGSPVAGGIIDELEGDGIQVEVEPDSSTTFSAIQIDPAEPDEPSTCSKPITYWTSTTAKEPPAEEPPAKEPPAEEPGGGKPPAGEPPASKPPAAAERPAVAPAAPQLKTAPAGPANDNTPRITGTAAGADSVRIFANSSCSGVPVATASPVALLAGVEIRVADNSTTDFAAIAVANGKQSPCSPPATYVEDSSPPHTRITMGPGAKTRHRKVIFRFADIESEPTGTSFVCKVDHRSWKACRSPFKLKHLSYRRHTLRVIGSDPFGNVESKAAKRSFKVIH